MNMKENLLKISKRTRGENFQIGVVGENDQKTSKFFSGMEHGVSNRMGTWWG
jgi:hypothetical protein